jgi:carboxylesterase type B
LHNHFVLEEQYGIILNVTGCSNLECLRSLPAAILANASQATYSVGYAAGDYGFGDFFYGPYVDGAVIRDLPSQEFKKGHFTKVPLLTNREGYEGTLFSNQNETNMTQEVLDLNTLFPYAKQSFFNRLFELYPSSNFNSTFFQRSQLFGDFIICCPTYYMSTAVSDSGNLVYKLIFDAGAENHGSLIPFTETINLNGMKVLSEVVSCSTLTCSLKGTSNNATIGDIVRDYYISFANSLDPNAISYTNISHPYWPTYQNNQNSNFSVLNVNYTMIGVIPDDDASAQCDFFHSQSYVIRN